MLSGCGLLWVGKADFFNEGEESRIIPKRSPLRRDAQENDFPPAFIHRNVQALDGLVGIAGTQFLVHARHWQQGVAHALELQAPESKHTTLFKRSAIAVRVLFASVERLDMSNDYFSEWLAAPKGLVKCHERPGIGFRGIVFVERAPVLGFRSVGIAKAPVREREQPTGCMGERSQLDSLPSVDQRRLVASLHHQQLGLVVMGGRMFWIELERLFQRTLCGGPIPVVLKQGAAQLGIGSGQRGIEGDRGLGGGGGCGGCGGS